VKQWRAGRHSVCSAIRWCKVWLCHD